MKNPMTYHLQVKDFYLLCKMLQSFTQLLYFGTDISISVKKKMKWNSAPDLWPYTSKGIITNLVEQILCIIDCISLKDLVISLKILQKPTQNTPRLLKSIILISMHWVKKRNDTCTIILWQLLNNSLSYLHYVLILTLEGCACANCWTNGSTHRTWRLFFLSL